VTIFDKANNLINRSESSFVNLLSAIAPWLAPLAPAYFTLSHLTSDSFELPFFVAFSVALTVEMLGFATISTIISFWSYNRRRMAEYKKAPLGTAMFAFFMYLADIMVINVMLDAVAISNNLVAEAWVVVIARAFLTLLSIPAAMLLATRTQHREMIDTIRREKEENQRVRKETKQRAQSDRLSPHSDLKRQFMSDVEVGGVDLDGGTNEVAKRISEKYGVSVRTAFRWIKSLR
jgi:hypothetical protein